MTIRVQGSHASGYTVVAFRVASDGLFLSRKSSVSVNRRSVDNNDGGGGVWASAVEMGSLWPDYKVITGARPWSIKTREADLWIEFTLLQLSSSTTTFKWV